MQKIKNNSIVIEIDYLNSELGKKIMNFNILYYQISFRDNQNMACYYVCKFKGTRLKDVPDSYLDWYLKDAKKSAVWHAFRFEQLRREIFDSNGKL